MEVPQIDMIAEDLGGLETEINREIQGLCQEYADQAVKRAEEYRGHSWIPEGHWRSGRP